MPGQPTAPEAVPMLSPPRLRTYLNRRILWGLLGCIYLVRRLTGPDRRLFVVPAPPTRWHVLWLITTYLGMRFTTQPENSALGCIHDDHTWVEPRPKRTEWPKIVLNSRCFDISKRRVAQVSEEVFGYSCDIDPTRHVGPMVKKSNMNGLHDGEIIDGPIDYPDPDCVYQQVIDNRADDNTIVDYRLSFIGNQFPFAIIKRRHLSIRFQGPYSHFEIVDPIDLFSASDLSRIMEMAKRMELDFGEIDVLRDRDTKRIYVIDVNKTPAYMILSWKTSLRIIRLAARCFDKEFLSSPALIGTAP